MTHPNAHDYTKKCFGNYVSDISQLSSMFGTADGPNPKDLEASDGPDIKNSPGSSLAKLP